MVKNYYVILGVPLDADPDAIRSAFRQLALRYHPDRGAGADPRAFRDISEAYGVLSDPGRRALYDRQLRRQPLVARPVPRSRTPARDPEPLISEPIPVTGDPDFARPSFEALFDHLGRNVFGLDLPKAEREEPLDFELLLSSGEAERGVRIPFEVPVFAICFWCAGTGRDWMFPCGECDGAGRIVDHLAVDVDIPAHVRDGTVIETSLERLGIRNLWLRVHVRVQRH